MVIKKVTIDLPKSGYTRELFCNDVYHIKPLHVRVTLNDDGTVKLFVCHNNQIEIDETVLKLNNLEV